MSGKHRTFMFEKANCKIEDERVLLSIKSASRIIYNIANARLYGYINLINPKTLSAAEACFHNIPELKLSLINFRFDSIMDTMKKDNSYALISDGKIESGRTFLYQSKIQSADIKNNDEKKNEDNIPNTWNELKAIIYKAQDENIWMEQHMLKNKEKIYELIRHVPKDKMDDLLFGRNDPNNEETIPLAVACALGKGANFLDELSVRKMEMIKQ
jgi:hypothetical protein